MAQDLSGLHWQADASKKVAGRDGSLVLIEGRESYLRACEMAGRFESRATELDNGLSRAFDRPVRLVDARLLAWRNFAFADVWLLVQHSCSVWQSEDANSTLDFQTMWAINGNAGHGSERDAPVGSSSYFAYNSPHANLTARVPPATIASSSSTSRSCLLASSPKAQREELARTAKRHKMTSNSAHGVSRASPSDDGSKIVSNEVDRDALASLMAMGFGREASSQVLLAFDNNLERSVGFLVSQ